ncbi:MAG: TROVE domain-containing protein [Williamsia sp.]|nr:TROVE domain-containing protein [Williamsia sp.]
MKFNFNKQISTTNHEGAKAYLLTPQLDLYAAVVTASLSNKYYETADTRLERIKDLIARNDARFVAKLAVYAREQMNLRSVPLVLTVELARQHRGDGLIAVLTDRVVQRADEITELLSYYALANERKQVKQLNRLSKQLQKGLAAAFNKFDEYQFAKYNRQANVKLKDALFLAHPKAKDETQQALFDKIAKDELEAPYTWEVELSALGQEKFAHDAAKQAAFRAKWEELIMSNKLGYMALLRNLRNILQAEVSNSALDKACSYIGYEHAVAKSRQLPFRFLSAYRELKELKDGRVHKVLEALEQAVLFSAANIKGFDENTRVVIAADVSGSMQTPVSARSSVKNYDIGLILAMLLQSRCSNVISGMFGDTWKVINMPRSNILGNVQEFYKREGEVGYSTNGYLVIEDLLQRKAIVDKIMVFTDCQLWNSHAQNQQTATSTGSVWARYKQMAPDAKLYLFDLNGYGNTPLNVQSNDVYLIAGWSDKVFDVLQALESGAGALDMINNMEL